MEAPRLVGKATAGKHLNSRISGSMMMASSECWALLVRATANGGDGGLEVAMPLTRPTRREGLPLLPTHAPFGPRFALVIPASAFP